MFLTPKFVGGVFVAIFAGVALNLGSLIQKKAVNAMMVVKKRNIQAEFDGFVSNEKLAHISISVKDLISDRMWMFGFLVQAVVGASLFIVAQGLIGPSLTPALGSIGLVVLVFASNIVDEKLTWDEYIGLLLMIGAVCLLALSHMVIDLTDTDFLNGPFMVRVAIYTGITIALCIFCKVWSWRQDKFEGPALATLSGLLVAIQNYWIGPFTSLITGSFHRRDDMTFEHHETGMVVLYILVSIVFVIATNLQTVYERQLAFRVGDAATMIPISHLPSHLSSPIIFSFVFYLKAPYEYSIPCMWAGLGLLLVCSIIFGKRGAKLETHHDGLEEQEKLLASPSVEEERLLAPSSVVSVSS